MKERFFAFFLILCLMAPFLPSPVMAEGGDLFCFDFEEDDLLWSGATFSRSAAYEGEFGIVADSPVGGPTDFGFASMLEYEDSVYLEEGLMYCLSFWIRSDSPSVAGNINALNINGSTLVFELFGIETDWKQLYVYFTVSDSRQYGFDLLLYTELEAPRIELDNICLSCPSMPPESYRFTGRQNLQIPFSGSETYRLPVASYNEYGDRIPTPVLTYASDDIPAGVSLNTRTGAVTVTDSVANDACMQLTALLSGVPVAETTIRFSRNLLRNGDFEDDPPEAGWVSFSTPFAIESDDEGNYLVLETPEGDDETSYGILEPENTVALQGGELYVFRALIHTTDLVPPSYLYTQNTSEDSDTSITVDMKGISGAEWSMVSCAIRPEKSGVYALYFRFFTQNHQPIYIDSVSLTQEALNVNEIRLSAPGHITVPSNGTEAFPLHIDILDQEGNRFDAPLLGMISPDDGAIAFDFDNECLLVSPDAAGEYLISVSTEDYRVSDYVSVSVSNSYLGDGDFEFTEVGEWWAAGDPAEMAFVPASYGVTAYSGNRMAEITLNDSFAGLLTNSYSHYSPDETYVFRGMFQKIYTDIPIDVTVVLSDADGNYTYIASDTLEQDGWQEISGIFSPEDHLTGKLLVFFSLDTDQHDQRVLLDDLAIAPLLVSADNVYLTGAFTPDSVATANYTFQANFKTEDASLVRWYVSNSENGNYALIDNQPTLLITPEMLGSYIRAEILPISLIGGFIGESTWSEPHLVSQSSPFFDPTVDPIPTQPPVETSRLFPRQLPQETSSGSIFSDIADHWAETEIGIMERAAIATGYENNTFRPDSSITRAEFTALLVRSFNLLPRAYSGQFQDVKDSDWYAGIIETAYAYQLINGVDASHFDPTAPITREQIALMVMRAYTQSERDRPTHDFIQFYDEYDMMPEAIPAIRSASGLGIINGMDNHTFSPKENATRAQAIVMLYRLLVLLNS